MGLGGLVCDKVRYIHANDGICDAEQGAAGGNGGVGEFFFAVKVVGTIGAGDQAKLDGFVLAVELGFSLPIAAMLQ